MNYEFLNPVCRYGNETHELIGDGENSFSNGTVRLEIEAVPVREGAEKLVCRWSNLSGAPLICQPEIRVRTTFVPTRWVIPGISYNGNEWGRGNEPKGFACEGEPWVFDDRRTAIPSCTVSENESTFFALFASVEDEASHLSSCSLEPLPDGTMLHRILWPEIERPKTYVGRDRYGEPHEDFVTIPAGGTFTASVFLLWGKPVLPNYGTANAEDAALELLAGPFPPRYTPEEIPALCCSFAKTLLRDVGERRLFCIGYSPNEENGFSQAWGSEFGWCGQNGMYARLMIERGTEIGDAGLAAIGREVLDAYSHEAVAPTGLIRTHYDRIVTGGSPVEDTCNLGFAVCELAKAWKFLHDHGEEHPDWLKASRGIADFMCSHWSEEWGFGKAWNTETGECADPSGTIGAYLIPGLTALYGVTGETRYLEAARRACRFYRDRDLVYFKCTAGALDTCCIDKETSGSLLAGAMDLYDIDGTEEWLLCAKMAGWYFCSWMFHHDTLNSPESDFGQYGYRTLGGTTVSAQHHHIDLWGALMVPYTKRLGEITGNRRWHVRADLLWANAIQNIAPAEGTVIHGRQRQAGAQNEAYFHCHWGDGRAPGVFNEWLVAWPEAFCWNTAEWMRRQEEKEIPTETV